MKGVLFSKLEATKDGKSTRTFILRYILFPVRSGILGFISFFVVLSTAKYFGWLLGTTMSFEIDGEDMMLSSMGFILVFLIKFLENFNEKTS